MSRSSYEFTNPSHERMGIMKILHRLTFVALLFAIPVLTDADDKSEFFEREVRPLLIKNCYECHSADSEEVGGKLRLDHITNILRGGESGPAIDKQMPNQSLILQAIRYTGDFYQMPPDGKLDEDDIAILSKWIKEGAFWPSDPLPAQNGNKVFSISESDRNFWAFQPITRPAVPAVDKQYRVSNPLDNFIVSKADVAGIIQASESTHDALVRRLFFSLTGLPPTVKQLQDLQDAPISTVIDSLLQSQRYGERWAQHWFDGVRYMSDVGYYNFNDKGWYYRDWVINALNQDMGYDDFIVHQIAGDLLPSSDPPKPYLAGMIATGVLAMGNFDDQDSDKERLYAEIIDDQIDMIGRQFLGLTLSCARCHDHKFDPISQRDYYALGGIFLSTKVVDDNNRIAARRIKYKAEPALFSDAIEAQAKEIAIQETTVKDLAAKELHSAAWRQAQAKLNSLRMTRIPQTDFISATEGGYKNSRHNTIGDMHLYRRGNPFNPGEKIPRGVPTLFTSGDNSGVTIPANRSGRLELARWIASADNPLTARVIVNRIWHYHFGRGIVSTPSNFGNRGGLPTHPELLDYLASELIEHDWSIKHIHRLILNSATYQQSSHVSEKQYVADPENLLYSRFELRRLSAEEIYDSLLLVAGKLKHGIGRVDSNRALYRRIGNSHQWLEGDLFDAPSVGTITPKRTNSTVAPQALYMLNNKMVIESARNLAAHATTHYRDPMSQIDYAFKALFGRSASDDELLFIRRKLNQLPTKTHWQIYQALIASNEFIYID